MQAYLILNAVSYLALAIWCIAAPDKTSTSLGFQLLNGSGRSEYFTVYGGMQFGFAAFFAFCAAKADRQLMGLIFAMALYLPIFTFRIISFLRYTEIGTTTYATAAFECILTIWGAYLLFQNYPRS